MARSARSSSARGPVRRWRAYRSGGIDRRRAHQVCAAPRRATVSNSSRRPTDTVYSHTVALTCAGYLLTAPEAAIASLFCPLALVDERLCAFFNNDYSPWRFDTCFSHRFPVSHSNWIFNSGFWTIHIDPMQA